MESRRLAYYTAAHMLVDMCCFYILYGCVLSCAKLGVTAAVLCFVLYNTLAFGLQAVFGYIADKSADKGKRIQGSMAVAGCSLLTAAVVGAYLPALLAGSNTCSGAAAYAAALTAAVGNALFHTGGGTDTLLSGEGRMAPNGIFVASGATGVALGTLAGRYFPMYGCAFGNHTQAAHILMTLLAASALALCVSAKRNSARDRAEPAAYDIASRGRGALFIVAAALAVVTLRSLVGSYMPVNPALYMSADGRLVTFALCATAGKLLGGVFGDVFGARRTAAVSLLLSGVLLCGGIYAPWLALPATLLFNMSMPITLCAAASKMPRRYGTAFGLTTVGLLLGSLPPYLIHIGYSARLWLCIPLIAASAALMLLCCCNKNTIQKTKED